VELGEKQDFEASLAALFLEFRLNIDEIGMAVQSATTAAICGSSNLGTPVLLGF